jgi:hypothetical protein
MTITLELSPEQETRLREKAGNQDADAVRQVLVQAMEPTVDTLLRDTSRQLSDAEFEACADQLADEWAASADPEALPLSKAAVSRDSIYDQPVVRPFPSGRCYLDNLDGVAEVLAWGEGDDFR